MKKKLIILANCPVASDSMGGGDRIAWEGFGKLGERFKTEVWGCQEALGQIKNVKLNLPVRQISNFPAQNLGVILAYLSRIVYSFFQKINIPPRSILYSASEFLPDLILPWCARLKKIPFFWAVGFYLVAKPPGSPENPWSLKAVLFYLAQQISILILKKYADRIYVLAENDKGILEKGGIVGNKLRVVRGGINPSEYQKVRGKRGSFGGIFIGRFHRQKGISDLLKIWEMVVNRIPSARLAIIGWGDRKWIEMIEEAGGRIGQDRIVFMGFKDKVEKIALLKSSRVFLFPSHYESWGIVTLEAMAAGVPVVAYDIPNLPKEIKENAVLVERFDKEQFAKKIIDLLQSPKKRAMLARKGKKISQNFSWEKLRQKLREELADV